MRTCTPNINILFVITIAMMFIFATLISIITSITTGSVKDEKVIKPEQIILEISEEDEKNKESERNEPLYSDEEVEVIVRTLAGECYDDKLKDKRLVVEVILNRVSDGRFGKDVLEVVSAKGQFTGYRIQKRPVSESDIQIAKDTLNEWYSNDCKALSEYLYFSSGTNRENIFRR